MNPNSRKRGSKPREEDAEARTTAHAAPALAGMIRTLSAGPSLEQQLARAFTRQGQPFDTTGVSTSWTGAERLAKRLTVLGCYLELQVHAGRCVCRVLRVLKGNAIAKQLASMEASALPEALAKAALLTLVEMEPPSTT
jgi:hypothetical protein